MAKTTHFQFVQMSKKITPYKNSSLSKKEQITKMFDNMEPKVSRIAVGGDHVAFIEKSHDN